MIMVKVFIFLSFCVILCFECVDFEGLFDVDCSEFIFCVCMCVIWKIF